jgi:exonuclease SbcC
MAGEEHVKSLGKQVSSAEKELETRQQKYEAEREKLPEKLSGLELEQIGLEISNNEKLFAKKLESIDIWETELNKYKESLEALNGKIAAEQLIEAGCAAELKKSRENALQLESEISEAQKRLESLEKEHADFLERYGIESADAELKRLADNDRRLHMLQKDAERLQTENDEKRIQVDRLKEELQGRKAELLQKDAELRGIEAQAEDKRSKLDALAGNIDIEAELVSIANKLEQYGTLEKKYQDKCSVLEKELNELTSRKALLENQSAIYHDDLKSIDTALIEAVRANGFNSESEVEESVIPPELCNELKKEIDSFNTISNNIKAQKELLQKKLGSRSITQEEWMRVSAEYSQTVELKEESISAYSIAKSAFDNITVKHDK